jgi:hypothetical protein
MATGAWWWGGVKRLGRLRLRKYRILPSLQKDYVVAKCQHYIKSLM